MSLFPSLFYGWVVTACAFAVLFVTYGVQYSFGVFLPAMLNELGWQRASLGGAFSLYTMVYSGCSWISGRLTDTAGPRWVVTAGGLLLLVLRSTASRKLVLAIAALLLATVAADLSLAAAIAGGAMKGDWALPVVFAVIPALGGLYGLAVAMGAGGSPGPPSATETGL